MREILFRGKAKDPKYEGINWLEGYLWDNGETRVDFRRYFIGDLDICKDKDGYDDINGFYMFEVATETIGQYTELKDKNGNRIFEGDFVKTKFGRICQVVFRSPSDYPGEVGFVGFDLKPIETKHKAPFDWDLWDSDNLEIIGNIYDNPELTGGAK